ncbi:MAG: DoxX family protein [Chlamydiales bacterium]|nr:DoxX family protein [Chlamydiales bacterium]
MKTLFAVLGRILLSLIFILSGIGKIFDWPGTESYLINALCDLLNYTQSIVWAQDLLQMAIPVTPQLLIVATIFELLGGVMMFFGIQVRFAAFLLSAFLIPVTLTFHHFWFLEGPDRQLQMIMFLKNLSILGGLFYILGVGKGSSSSPKKAKESD